MSGTDLVIPPASELTRVAEARWATAEADAVVDIARRAQLTDEDILPLLRQRGDVWRRWGDLLGEPESGAPRGNQNAANNVSSEHVEPLDNDERQRRKKARKIASVTDERYAEWQAAQEPEMLTFTCLLSGGAHVSNNAGDSEWFTPSEYIEAATAVMGDIDLDPATTPEANEVVGASTIYTASDDGLRKDWMGRVWMNPPYARPLVDHFCAKLAESYSAGDVSQACVLVNNATETGWFHALAEVASAMCFPRQRVKFWHPEKKSAPLQGQSCIYLGDNVDDFRREFLRFGFTVVL